MVLARASEITSVLRDEKNIFINQYSYKRGLIVVVDSAEESDEAHDSQTKICINKRLLQFYDFGKSQEQDARKLISLFNKTKDKLVRLGLTTRPRIFLYNPERKDEIFIPYTDRNDRQVAEVACYLYPWARSQSESDFEGFKSFSMCGCMFGASLKGKTTYENMKILIDHNIEFGEDEKVIEIVYNGEHANPYEENLFIEFERNLKLIDKIGSKTNKIEIFYHLPDLDYILFGIRLLINKNMTFEAFNHYVFQILEKSKQYRSRLNAIVSQRENVDMMISSPFINLFSDLLYDDGLEINANNLILKLFGRFPYDEKNLVSLVRDKLLTNDFDSNQKTLWETIFNAESRVFQINSIEDVLKSGNVLMIAMASTQYGENKTCSLLPLTEKQIQIRYEKYSSDQIFPNVYNITVLDSVILNLGINKSSLFYADDGNATLAGLVSDRPLRSQADANLSIFT